MAGKATAHKDANAQYLLDYETAAARVATLLAASQDGTDGTNAAELAMNAVIAKTTAAETLVAD